MNLRKAGRNDTAFHQIAGVLTPGVRSHLAQQLSKIGHKTQITLMCLCKNDGWDNTIGTDPYKRHPETYDVS